VIQGRFGLITGLALRPYPLIRVGVGLPGITSGIQYLEFILDTGAMVTSISAVSALTPLGVPVPWFTAPTGIVARESLGGVGGHITTTVVNATYRFRHHDGRSQDITGHLRIADVASPAVPPLIGWDVLERFDVLLQSVSGEVTLTEPRRPRKPRSR